MLFAEKLKQLRGIARLTQEEVALKIGVSYRTYQNYESGRKYPRKAEAYGKLAELFGVTTDYLISQDDQYVIEAGEKGGAKAMTDVKALIAEVSGLFAGGELTQEDKDKVMMALNEVYWEAKSRNKEKFTPKKYRKTSE